MRARPLPDGRGSDHFALYGKAAGRGVHVLGRVGKHVVFKRTETFSDGSYLAVIYPSDKDRRHQVDGLVVHVIEYTLDEPNRTVHGECHRAAMIQHIAQGRLPPRANRIDPRVVQKKMSNFGKKRPEHCHPPQSRRPFEQSVVIFE